MRNDHVRGQGGQDIVLRNDMKNYRKAWEKMRTAEKINNERALEHRLLWEKLKKINPNPTDEDLLAHAKRLEEQGLLAEAADAYQQLLTRPDQFHDKAIRDHLAELIKRHNRRQAEAKTLERAAELEEEGRLWPGRPRGLESPRGRPHPGLPRVDKLVGPMMPMSPEAYRAELAAQAMDNKRRRDAAKLHDHFQEQKQVAVVAALEALEQYQRRVGGANNKIAYANELVMDRRDRGDEHRQQFLEDWDHLKPVGGPDVRQSYDLDERRREQDYQQRQQRDGAVAVALNRPRPASAAPAAILAAREKERDRNNAANFHRMYVPGHPYAPPGGPPAPQEAWPAAPRPHAAVKLQGGMKSPHARPGVDKPRVRIDPQVVRGHQQAFIEKHKKPAPFQKQHVSLRQRKEEARRPEMPMFAGAAGGEHGRQGGWT